MTKAELIQKIAEDAEITQKAAETVINSVTRNIIDTLKKKESRFTLTGFGTFSKVHRKARKGRNPQTGEQINIKAKNVIKFQAGKELKEALN